MKVLLSCVGSSDPYGKEEANGLRTAGPALATFYEVKPDCLILFPTGGPGGTSPRVTGMHSALSSENVDIKAYEFTPANPALLEDVLPSLGRAVRKALEELQKKTDDTLEIHIGVASGTPAMKQTWMVLYGLGHFGRAALWQSLDPTRLGPGDKRAVPLRIDLVQRPTVLDAVEHLTDVHLYERALRELELFENMVLRQHRSQSLICLAEVFEAWIWWDELNYAKSRERLQFIRKDMAEIPSLRPLTDLIERQCTIADAICSGSKDEREREQIINLGFLAERCNARGELIASLALSRRVYEECLHSRARKRGIEYSDMNLVKLRFALITNGDTEMSEFNMRNTKVDRIMGHRNSSIAGHGMKAVTQKLANDAIAMVNAALTELLGVDQAVVESHPFSPKVMRAAVNETLRQIRLEPV